ncbi:MAG: MauE/DoxX family redox-associated membrane protein, partial [Actinomycetota bacterium]
MTPDAYAPAFLLAAGLLVVAGAVKMAAPRATAQAILDAGLPGSDAVSRCLGAVEVGAGLWALFAPAAGGAAALAAVYLGFAAFLAYVLRTHPDAGSCGCAGAKAVPPSRLHLALNVLAAVTGVAYVVIGGPSAVSWLSSLGIAGALGVLAGLALAV